LTYLIIGKKKANLVLTPIFDVSENFGWSIIHGLLIIQMYINKEYDGIYKRQEGTIQQVLGGLEKTLYEFLDLNVCKFVICLLFYHN
jgi:hypothetical protein